MTKEIIENRLKVLEKDLQKTIQSEKNIREALSNCTSTIVSIRGGILELQYVLKNLSEQEKPAPKDEPKPTKPIPEKEKKKPIRRKRK